MDTIPLPIKIKQQIKLKEIESLSDYRSAMQSAIDDLYAYSIKPLRRKKKRHVIYDGSYSNADI